jgi:hypothetical protein
MKLYTLHKRVVYVNRVDAYEVAHSTNLEDLIKHMKKEAESIKDLVFVHAFSYLISSREAEDNIFSMYNSIYEDVKYFVYDRELRELVEVEEHDMYYYFRPEKKKEN